MGFLIPSAGLIAVLVEESPECLRMVEGPAFQLLLEIAGTGFLCPLRLLGHRPAELTGSGLCLTAIASLPEGLSPGLEGVGLPAGPLFPLPLGQGPVRVLSLPRLHLFLPGAGSGAVLGCIGVLPDQLFHFLVIFDLVGLVNLCHPTL